MECGLGVQSALGPDEQPAAKDRGMAAALVAVLAAGFLARSVATLFPPLVVGDDGAYYLVQVRAILRDGSLAIPDFPLLFYIQACVALVLSFAMDQRTAIVAAVRITDTLLPLALAVPVFLFARAFQRPDDRPEKGMAAVVLVGLVAVGSGSTLLMAGGMIKNAVALPCSFLFAFASYEWIRVGRAGALAWAGFWFALASLTHMGGFILSTAFAAGVLAIGLAIPTVRPRIRVPAMGLLACLAGCLAIVFAFDSERALRLVGAVVDPTRLFAEAPAAVPLHAFLGGALRAAFTSVEAWLGNTLGVLGAITFWRHRADADASTRVLLAASTFVTLAFSFPLLEPDVLQRLALLAYVPGMIPVVYLICREGRSAAVVAPLILVVLLQGALAVKTLRLTALVPAAYEELVSFRASLPPGRVIVIARPLLRWWVAWTLETHFSTRVEPALAAREAYDAVLVLDEIRGGAFGSARAPYGIGGPAAGVKDADLLRAEHVRTLAEGAYCRLRAVDAKSGTPSE